MLSNTVKAELILEDGTRFVGRAFGHISDVVGEVVFTTAIPGYQEILTDASFSGQIVCMTYPLVGNYGINLEDMESDTPRLKALIVREKCDSPSNWRCEMELEGFFKQHNIVGLEGIDTRMLTRALSNKGTMKGIITTEVGSLPETEIRQRLDNHTNSDAVAIVTTNEKYTIGGSGAHLAVIDLGVKKSVLNEFQKRKCKLTVYPAFTSADDILADNPDGIFVSNGPGCPFDIKTVVETVKILMESKPVIGTGLGHQLIGSALNLEISKLKCGHLGGHPVKDTKTGRIYTTPQNHQYVIANTSDNENVTFKSINDSSIEGIKHKRLPIYSVQFNPEASPGATDTNFIFDEMLDVVNASAITQGGKANA